MVKSGQANCWLTSLAESWIALVLTLVGIGGVGLVLFFLVKRMVVVHVTNHFDHSRARSLPFSLSIHIDAYDDNSAVYQLVPRDGILWWSVTSQILLLPCPYPLSRIPVAYYLPMYFQILGSSATGAGKSPAEPLHPFRLPLTTYRMLPFFLGAALFPAIPSFIVTKLGLYRPGAGARSGTIGGRGADHPRGRRRSEGTSRRGR